MTKKKTKPIYCGKCIYYIDHMENKDTKQPQNDICGYYLHPTKDPVGRDILKLNGHVEQCPTCATVLQDDQRLITRSCLHINRKNNCEQFRHKNSIIRALKYIFGI